MGQVKKTILPKGVAPGQDNKLIFAGENNRSLPTNQMDAQAFTCCFVIPFFQSTITCQHRILAGFSLKESTPSFRKYPAGVLFFFARPGRIPEFRVRAHEL
jgi:hypothetical protein